MKPAYQIAMPLGNIENDFEAMSSAQPYDALSFRENAPDLDDQQVLDYILSLSASRNRSQLAARLLDSFGSLKNVLEARPEQLRTVSGIGEKTANMIAAFIPVMNAWSRRAGEQLKQITNRNELERYCKSILSGNRNEEFWVICVDARCRLLGKRRISIGTLSECSTYPRSVVETALNYNAHSVFLTHNHPGGTCAPSAEDIQSTVRLQKTLNDIGILVLDHIIVAGDKTYSFAQHGDMDFRR